MAVIINYDLKTSRGEPYTALDRVIRLRQEQLHETAEDAVVATMITVLRSIRAATMVAKPDRFKGVCAPAPSQYFAGWRMLGGKPHHCIRLGFKRGPILTGAYFVTLVPPGTKGEQVFMVEDAPPDMPKKYHDNYFIIAADAAVARKYARARHKKRVLRYMGLAQYAISVAQGKVSTRSQPMSVAVRPKAKSAAIVNVKKLVRKTASSYSVSIVDSIRYATKALRGGAGAVELAMMKAANSTVGYLRKDWSKWHGSWENCPTLKTPFPGISKHGG